MFFDTLSTGLYDFSLVFVKNVSKLSVLSSVLMFIIIPIKNFFCKKTTELVSLINSMLAAGSLPVAVALFLCAIYENLIKEMSGLEVNLLIAGAALLFISIAAIVSEW